MALLTLYARVLAMLGPELRLGLILAVANVALAGTQFAEPVLLGRIIDVLTRAQANNAAIEWGSFTPLVLLWIVFGLFTIGASVLVALHADRLSHRRRLAAMARYFEHVLTLPVSFHTNVHSGRVLKVKLEGANGMAWIWLSFFREHFAAFVMLALMLPFTLVLNWRLGSVLVLLLMLFAGLTIFVLRKTEVLQGTVEHYNTSLAEHAADALGNVPVVQSFTRIENEATAMREIIQQVLNAQIPVLSWWAVAAVATRAAATLTVLAIFLLGTWLNMHGLASVGEIVSFMSLSSLLIAKMEQAVSFVNHLFLQGPKIAEFFDILDTVPSVRDLPGARAIGKLRGEVRFEDVSFSYDGKTAAVADLTLDVRPGDRIALVGATGSGKSTTLGLLHRAFDPQSGRILVDGVDIRQVTLASLRQNIGVVFQEPMLFARSIADNIRVGRPAASDAEVMLAVERAQAADFVGRSPDGLNTVIGERGRSLSGGERQRLSIARALLKDPPILILDEATSALDAGTEAKLQIALEEVMQGRTTFVIAHRLATIRNADRILLFERGRIVEAGSFDDLVARNGRFAELARAQFMAHRVEAAAVTQAAP
jgi:glucan exporter ATP-binding protein